MFRSVRIFGIRNKRSKVMWVADSGKFKWFRSQDAKGAFWSTEKYYFREQNEWEIVEFKLVEVLDSEKVNDDYYRTKLGLK